MLIICHNLVTVSSLLDHKEMPSYTHRSKIYSFQKFDQFLFSFPPKKLNSLYVVDYTSVLYLSNLIFSLNISPPTENPFTEEEYSKSLMVLLQTVTPLSKIVAAFL